MAILLSNKLKMKGIDKVAIENPRRLLKDKLFNDIGMNIVSFLEKFRKLCEKMEIKVIFVNPRRTSERCPKCNKKLEILNEDIHILHCPFCEITFDKDEIASWNILNRGIEKIK
jgi:transposase